MVVIRAAAAITAAAAFGTWAVRGRSSTIFGSSVWRGPNSTPAIALSFDDGPSESTPALLEILAKHQARATFFQCGTNVQRLPDIARAVAAAGHELGNHTHTHPRLYFKSAAFMEEEIGNAQSAIVETTGVAPRLFRAPYGVRWFGLRAAQRRFDLLGVMWTTIGQDWRLSARAIADRLLEGAANGAIFCLHDGRTTQPQPDIQPTLDAVRSAIPLLLDRGFRLVTISELLCLNPQHQTSPPNPPPIA